MQLSCVGLLLMIGSLIPQTLVFASQPISDVPGGPGYSEPGDEGANRATGSSKGQGADRARDSSKKQGTGASGNQRNQGSDLYDFGSTGGTNGKDSRSEGTDGTMPESRDRY